MIKEYSYNTKGIVIYVYERDYSLMNNLVAEAFKEYYKTKPDEK